MKTYSVYIMANDARTTYVGVTNDLERRVWEHRCRTDTSSFTGRHGLSKLVYFEDFGNIQEAIDREKQLKNWRRSKKLALINAVNPDWADLSVDWFRDSPIEANAKTHSH